MEFDTAVVLAGMAGIGLLLVALMLSLARTFWCPGRAAEASPLLGNQHR